MRGTLIRCIDCNKIINMTEWDHCPHYTWHNGEIEEQEGKEREIFLKKHKGHKTEQLIPLTPPLSDKPYTDPLKSSYFMTTNGKRRFLIKRWRTKINDPLTYEIIDGSMIITNGKVRVQTEAIKKQMMAEQNSFITEEKLNHFIDAIHLEAERIDPDTLEESAEGETPLISFFTLGKKSVERILHECRDTFDQHELTRLRDFVIEHNEYDDVMTLVAKKELIIHNGALKGRGPIAVRTSHHAPPPPHTVSSTLSTYRKNKIGDYEPYGR